MNYLCNFSNSSSLTSTIWFQMLPVLYSIISEPLKIFIEVVNNIDIKKHLAISIGLLKITVIVHLKN